MDERLLHANLRSGPAANAAAASENYSEIRNI
jgi:hypothetical protein